MRLSPGVGNLGERAGGVAVKAADGVGGTVGPFKQESVVLTEIVAGPLLGGEHPDNAALRVQGVHLKDDGGVELVGSQGADQQLLGAVTIHIQQQILETTIQGGLSVNNATAYWVDLTEILSAGPGLRLPQGEPQILIIHTHSSEAYTQAGLDRYEPSDTNRTENTEFNIVRIGDELTEIFQQAGLNVIHDRGIYDYPSYTGSYTRSGQAIEQYLRDYPSIQMVIDIHRDALGTDDVVYKTMAEEDGVCASQVMLLIGTDESGLEHPNWRQNLAVALYMQNAVNARHPTLMRPIALVQQRYNQHLSPGSMILEVGSNGNTLQEALAAIRLFGQAAAPALAALVE